MSAKKSILMQNVKKEMVGNGASAYVRQITYLKHIFIEVLQVGYLPHVG